MPAGGYFLWLGLPDGVSAESAVKAAREAGVTVSDGRPFMVNAHDSEHIRVSFSMLDVDLLREGAARLNRAIASIMS